MRKFLPALAALALAFPAMLGAQSVVTDPVGFTTLTCLGGSDTVLQAPFTRMPEFAGSIASVSGNVITVSGTPFTASQFVYVQGSQPKTYFALIGPHASSNPNEGRIYSITANSTSTLTVNLGGDSISGIQANTQVLVIPYFTLATLFPASDANVSFIPTASLFSIKTQLLIPDYAGTGINRSAPTSYYFMNSAWRKFGNPATEDHSDDVLLPAAYFILRNPAGSPTNLTSLGNVLTKKETIPLATQAGAAQDNFVNITRPIDVSLDNLGLITSGAFTATTSLFNLADQLLVFNNAAAGINKSASATYYYMNSHWRKFGQDSNTDFGGDVIPAGAGFIIRKVASGNGATAFWTNAPTY